MAHGDRDARHQDKTEVGDGAQTPAKPSSFVHDANQCLHVIRLAAETLRLDAVEGKLDAAKVARRSETILAQVDQLSTMIATTRSLESTPASIQAGVKAGQEADTEFRPRILVADDEALSSMMLAEYLERGGYTVDIAYDGLAALGFCRSSLYAAVVTDIRMPGLDGHQLIAQLEEIQPGTPAIVVTGHLDPKAPGTLGDNVAAIFAKPFDPADLKRKLDDLLGTAAPRTRKHA
jgi:CheY-like chemotaxis protein